MSANDLKKLGAQIEYVLCVILRDENARANLKKEGLELVSLFTMTDLSNNDSV